MFISPAWAHGTGGAATETGPLILLGVAVAAILFFVGRGKWRKYKEQRAAAGL